MATELKAVMLKIIDATAKAIHKKGAAGWRFLGPNTFRTSVAAPGCSYSLFYDKTLGKNEAPEFKRHWDKVFQQEKPDNGAAVSGTCIHELLEDELNGEYEFAELEIDNEYEVNLWDNEEAVHYGELQGETVEPEQKTYKVRVTGHVDQGWKLQKDGELYTLDVKSLSPHTYDQIIGLKASRPGSYARKKILKSERQSNFYCGAVDGVAHFILWIDRNNLRFHVDSFQVKPDWNNDVIKKLACVLQAVDRFNEGDKQARPPLLGMQECTYCEWKGLVCPGKDLLHVC